MVGWDDDATCAYIKVVGFTSTGSNLDESSFILPLLRNLQNVEDIMFSIITCSSDA